MTEWALFGLEVRRCDSNCLAKLPSKQLHNIRLVNYSRQRDCWEFLRPIPPMLVVPDLSMTFIEIFGSTRTRAQTLTIVTCPLCHFNQIWNSSDSWHLFLPNFFSLPFPCVICLQVHTGEKTHNMFSWTCFFALSHILNVYRYTWERKMIANKCWVGWFQSWTFKFQPILRYILNKNVSLFLALIRCIPCRSADAC